MLHRLPGALHGLIMTVLLVVNTLFWALPVYALILVKLLTPSSSAARRLMDRAIAATAQQWAVTNTLISRVFMRIDFQIDLKTSLNPKGQYLVCCNHQSWNDIFVLMRTFGRQAPFFKFFLKRELIWVPVLGLAWWGLDYPFMKRHSKQAIERNPALKGQDIATTKRACERYKGQPVMILNFLEGTRFTAAKHAQQQSPYRHLLKPKAGGFAFALSAMGQDLNSLLDVTIVYPDGAKGFWDFLAGRVRQVRVEVRQLTIPDEWFAGDYENDAAFRARFQQWIAQLWHDKDARIHDMLAR